MTTAKRTLLTALAVLGAVLVIAVGTLLVVDDATLVGMLVKRVESASNTRISYRDDASLTRSWAPLLSISELHIADIDQRYQAETESLQLQLSLPYLLIGRLDIPRLHIGDTQLNVTGQPAPDKSAADSGKKLAVDLSALRLEPVLHDLQISHLTVSSEGEHWHLPQSSVSELSLGRGKDRRTPQLTAQVEVGKERLHIEATLPGLHASLQQQQLPFLVAVKGDFAELTAEGQVDFSQPVAALKAALKAHSPDLSNLDPGVEALKIPGQLTATAEIDGSFDRLAVAALSVDWTGPGQSRLDLKGRMDDLNDFAGIDLELTGRLEDAGWLTPLLPATMAALATAELSARMAGDANRLAVSAFDLKFKTSDELDLSLAGRFDLARGAEQIAPENMDLKLAFNAPATRAARALLFDTVPEFGAITATGEFHSQSGHPALENIVLKTRDTLGIEVDLAGRIAQFPLDPSPNRGYDLDVSMKSTNTSLMLERVGLELELSGPLDLDYRIEGDTQALQLNRIKLSAGDSKPTLLKAQGQMVFGAWDRQDPLDTIDLQIEMHGNGAVLRAAVEQELPPLAYVARLRLHTVSGQHRIDDYRLHTPPGEPLLVTETGHADSVVFFPAFDIQGVYIANEARTDDTASLNELFGLDERIPAIGPLEAKFLISGSDEKLLISDVALTAGQEDVLLVTMNGRLGHISAAEKWQLTDTELSVDARSSSSEAFFAALGYPFPVRGPLTARASLSDKDKSLGLDAIQLLVGDGGNPVLHSTGALGDLYAGRDIHLDTSLRFDKQNFAGFADNADISDSAALTGTMVISDSKGSLGIDKLQIETSGSERLDVKISGSYDNFKDPETLWLDSHLQARDLHTLGLLFDRQWSDTGPVQFDGRVKQAGEDLNLNAMLSIAKATSEMNLSGDFDTDPPYISGKITARDIFFRDPFDRVAEKKAAEDKEREKKEETSSAQRVRGKKQRGGEQPEKVKQRQKKPTDKTVLSRKPLPFDWLKKADLDLVVDAESFDRDEWDAESAQFKLALKSGVLSLSPATFVYPKGQLVLDLQVDASEEPKLSFKASAHDLNPGAQTDSDEAIVQDFLNADWDMEVSLQASGESVYALASGAQGDIYITVQDGWIRRSMIDLLFVDLVGWAYRSRRDNRIPVNCGVADFSIDNGVVSTDAFFLDTRTITITGEGTIDLGKETIDYVFIPRKKSRVVLKAEPVKVKGPLQDPSVKAVPVKSAALTFGTLLFAPYVFVGLTATGMVSEELNHKDDPASVCQKYKRKFDARLGKETTAKP